MPDNTYIESKKEAEKSKIARKRHSQESYHEKLQDDPGNSTTATAAISESMERLFKLIQELEEKGLSFEQVVEGLERRIRSEKTKADKGERLAVPAELFSNRKLGVLEMAVKFLKEEIGLRYSEIADLLDRDDRTIWAVYHQAVKKLPKKGHEKRPASTTKERGDSR
ncbi:hypothetical protein GF351_03145 [Candidatus Woesearchaeota archaeon]|nr:hypothetical protein [Candidatus Woesearchaeota archaeon]